MPYTIVTRDGKHCVVKEDDPEGHSYGCHDTPEEAQRQIAAILASEHAGKADWLTVDQVREFCPSCADKMVAKGLTRLNLEALKALPGGMPPQMFRGMCDAFAPADGFRTRCMEAVGPHVTDPGAFCNALKEACFGSVKVDGSADAGTLVMVQALKAVGDWELEVLAVPFGGPRGGKDSHGEYFDARSDLGLKKAVSPFVHYYHGFTPDGKPQGNPVEIGDAKYARTDARGVWYRIVLDKTKALAKRVWEAAKKGKAQASSGSIAHLRRVSADGHVDYWPLAEISVFDVEGFRQPANLYAVAVPVAKAFCLAIGEPYQGDEGEDANARGEQHGGQHRSEDPNRQFREGDIEMDEKELEAKIAGAVGPAVKAALDARDADAKVKEAAEKAEKDKIAAAVAAERTKWDAEAAKTRRLPFSAAPAVAKYGDLWQFDALDAGDMAIVVGILEEACQRNVIKQRASEAALKALAIKLFEDKTHVGTMGRGAMKACGLIDGGDALKANELDYSTQASYGDEWVGVGYSQAIWDAIRVEALCAGRLPSVEVPRGFESWVVPLEGADPTFYKVAETTDTGASGWPVGTVTTSKLGTAKATLNLAKMGARVIWSGELDERSLVSWAPQLRKQLQVSGAEQFDHTIIDGDVTTTATTNINDIGNGSAQTATNLYLLYDGLRKLALVTNTANSRSAGGSLAGSDFLATALLMGPAGINALDRSKAAFIIDPNVHWKAVDLPEVKTKDAFSQPTLEGGMLKSIYGFEVLVSPFMHWKSAARKANTAGKVDQTTPANNTTGSILAVRWDQWLVGYQRRMTIETTRIARADAYEIVALMSVGLINRDTEASAISYNVGV